MLKYINIINIINFIDISNTSDGYNLSNADGIWGAIAAMLRSFMYSVNELIYKLIIILYDIFEMISKARLLVNETTSLLSKRIAVILGIIMLFNVMFKFITYLLNPEKITDEKTGAVSIIKKCIIVIVMLGTSNYFFSIAWQFQNLIIEQRIIYRILLPTDVELATDKFGGVLAARTFTSFYKVEDYFVDNSGASVCVAYHNHLITEIINQENFSRGYYCLNSYGDKKDGDGEKQDYFIMQYNYLLQLLFGIGLIYILISYVIKVGVRIIQLTVLEIISPMAIISYLSPKQDNMFTKWWKIYFSTYIDVFIRSAIIYFAVYLSAILFDSIESANSTFWESIGEKNHVTLITLIMVLALLMFAKKAPDLLKELFPEGASKLGLGGVSFKDMLGGNVIKAGMKAATAGTAIGLIGASMSGVSRYKANRYNGKGKIKSGFLALGGAATAIPRGMISGGRKGNVFANIPKGLAAQKAADDAYEALITRGGTRMGQLYSNISSYYGMTSAEILGKQIGDNKAIIEANNNIGNLADQIDAVKKAKAAYERAQYAGDKIEAEKLYEAYKTAKKNAITDALSNPSKFKDPEDIGIVGDIRNIRIKTETDANNHNVRLKDANGNNIANVFDSYEKLKKAAAYAQTNINEITPEYERAQANSKNTDGKGGK